MFDRTMPSACVNGSAIKNGMEDDKPTQIIQDTFFIFRLLAIDETCKAAQDWQDTDTNDAPVEILVTTTLFCAHWQARGAESEIMILWINYHCLPKLDQLYMASIGTSMGPSNSRQ